MHNSSYAGGLVGIVVAMTSILRRFLRVETGSAKYGTDAKQVPDSDVVHSHKPLEAQ
jgi:hypothetical protein